MRLGPRIRCAQLGPIQRLAEYRLRPCRRVRCNRVARISTGDDYRPIQPHPVQLKKNLRAVQTAHPHVQQNIAWSKLFAVRFLIIRPPFGSWETLSLSQNHVDGIRGALTREIRPPAGLHQWACQSLAGKEKPVCHRLRQFLPCHESARHGRGIGTARPGIGGPAGHSPLRYLSGCARSEQISQCFLGKGNRRPLSRGRHFPTEIAPHKANHQIVVEGEA